MSQSNKLGGYITKLMTTVMDNNEDDFVKDLAITELNRLKVNIDEFLVKHLKVDEVAEEKVEKQLLQEEKDDRSK